VAFPSFPEGSCSNISRFTSLALLCVAACSLAHSAVAQTNSLSSSAPNTVGLWANGTEYLHIGSTGFVGIGTLAPNTTLQVNGSIMVGTGTCGSSTAGSIQWNGSALQYCNGSSWTTLAGGIAGSGTTNYLARWTPNGSTLGIGATYDNGTDVGIGNTSPTNILSVGPSGNVGQTSAYIQARSAGNSFEWGHGNAAGYASTLGAWAGSGQPFLCFDCEAGTTANTFKTRGIKGALLTSDLTGGFIFATVPTASADNQTATNNVVITTGGNVGIGTTAPQTALQVRTGADQNLWVHGPNNLSGGIELAVLNDAISALVPMELHASTFDFTGGNVGIGTTAPTNLVEVAGGSLNGIGLMVDGTSNTVGIGINNFQTGGRNWSLVSKGGSSGAPDAFAIQDSTASGANRIVIDASGDVGIGGTVGASSSAITAGTLVAMASGNVGIGTTGPNALLDIYGNGTAKDLTLGLWASNTNYNAIYLNGAYATQTSYNLLSSSTDQNLYINAPSSGALYLRNANNNVAAVNSAGMAIGGTYAALAVSPPSNGLIVQGGVGIGTTAPRLTLESMVTNNTVGTYYPITARLDRSSTSSSPRGVGISFTESNNGTVQQALAGVVGIRENSNSTWYSDLAFQVNTANASGGETGLSDVMYIQGSSASVGIGTTNPTTALTVIGTATATNFSGTLNPDYDSGWVSDSNSTSHLTTFTHSLGVIPTRCEIQFSPTNTSVTTVYPLSCGAQTSFTTEYSNPIGVQLTTTTVVLSIYTGASLFAYWNATSWTTWASGYWRVRLWK
jgi:hypothetical protein